MCAPVNDAIEKNYSPFLCVILIDQVYNLIKLYILTEYIVLSHHSLHALGTSGTIYVCMTDLGPNKLIRHSIML